LQAKGGGKWEKRNNINLTVKARLKKKKKVGKERSEGKGGKERTTSVATNFGCKKERGNNKIYTKSTFRSVCGLVGERKQSLKNLTPSTSNKNTEAQERSQYGPGGGLTQTL